MIRCERRYGQHGRYGRFSGRQLEFLLVLISSCAFGELAVQDEWAAHGEVVIGNAKWQARYSRGEESVTLNAGGQAVEIAPCYGKKMKTGILKSCELVENPAKPEIEIRTVFSVRRKKMAARFRFNAHGMLRVTPCEGLAGVAVRAPIAIGVLPDMRLEDVLYEAGAFANTKEVWVPSENCFAALLDGFNGILACAWPEGRQTVRLRRDNRDSNIFGALAITLGGRELYLELLAAPGIWHKETLALDYLERKVETGWKRPFSVTYKTQFSVRAESTTVHTFLFSNDRTGRWWPEIGQFTWPVWFEKDQACLFLSKKIPPRGSAVFYPFDGNDQSLMGFLRRTPAAEIVTARGNARGLPAGPRHAPNVGFNACWGTYLLRRTIYMRGVQHRCKDFLGEHADYLADRVAMIQRQNTMYFAFIARMRERLEALRKKAPRAARRYLEDMAGCLDALEEGHQRKMVLYGDHTPEAHIAHAERNRVRLRELLETDSPEVYVECERIIDEFNRMSWGHNENTGMRFSLLAREWAQRAALDCTGNPRAVQYAEEIRSALREALNGTPAW